MALRLLPIALRGAEALVCDKGCAGRDFEQLVGERFGARMLRPAVPTNPTTAFTSSIRQLVESVF